MPKVKKAASPEGRTLKEQMEEWLKQFVDEYVPIEYFGKDHWTTFAYAETCCVDYGGVLDNRRMRCHPRRHRAFAAVLPFSGTLQDGSGYPTRLKCGILLKNHDDWDALQDLEQAGLLKITADDIIKTKRGPRRASEQQRLARGPFPQLTCRVELTALGRQIASEYRAHLAAGKNSFEFEVPAEILAAKRESRAAAA